MNESGAGPVGVQVRGGDDGGDIGAVGQQGLAPTSADARLWAIQIRPGCEREAVVCIMSKAVEYAHREEQLGMAALGIKAVFCQDHLPVRPSMSTSHTIIAKC